MTGAFFRDRYARLSLLELEFYCICRKEEYKNLPGARTSYRDNDIEELWKFCTEKSGWDEYEKNKEEGKKDKKSISNKEDKKTERF